jgi:hypothetical protein
LTYSCDEAKPEWTIAEVSQKTRAVVVSNPIQDAGDILLVCNVEEVDRRKLALGRPASDVVGVGQGRHPVEKANALHESAMEGLTVFHSHTWEDRGRGGSLSPRHERLNSIDLALGFDETSIKEQGDAVLPRLIEL